jgi:hypothetical protein
MEEGYYYHLQLVIYYNYWAEKVVVTYYFDWRKPFSQFKLFIANYYWSTYCNHALAGKCVDLELPNLGNLIQSNIQLLVYYYEMCNCNSNIIISGCYVLLSWEWSCQWCLIPIKCIHLNGVIGCWWLDKEICIGSFHEWEENLYFLDILDDRDFTYKVADLRHIVNTLVADIPHQRWVTVDELEERIIISIVVVLHEISIVCWVALGSWQCQWEYSTLYYLTLLVVAWF